MTNQRTVTVEPGTQSIGFSREFEASADRVFRAHVDSDLVAQWTGPKGTELKMREFDARTGGSWSYVVVGKNDEWAFFGSFHEVSPGRIVQTWEFEGDPGHPTFETLTFTDLGGGRSRIDGVSLFGSVEARDAMADGMDAGLDENYDQLEALLAG